LVSIAVAFWTGSNLNDIGMDYEGIYRKNGGSSQSKLITQLFERGDYEAFDLRDSDAFNDICSVTSVLKNYFRALPDPLLTYQLHEAFVSAACESDSYYGEAIVEVSYRLKGSEREAYRAPDARCTTSS
jgi:hypothetical protein